MNGKARPPKGTLARPIEGLSNAQKNDLSLRQVVWKLLLNKCLIRRSEGDGPIHRSQFDVDAAAVERAHDRLAAEVR